MATKTIKTRIQNKYDIETNWNEATFKPLKGELIVYGVDPNDPSHKVPRLKIGDEVTPIGELPIIDVDSKLSVKTTPLTHGEVVNSTETVYFNGMYARYVNTEYNGTKLEYSADGVNWINDLGLYNPVGIVRKLKVAGDYLFLFGEGGSCYFGSQSLDVNNIWDQVNINNSPLNDVFYINGKYVFYSDNGDVYTVDGSMYLMYPEYFGTTYIGTGFTGACSSSRIFFTNSTGTSYESFDGVSWQSYFTESPYSGYTGSLAGHPNDNIMVAVAPGDYVKYRFGGHPWETVYYNTNLNSVKFIDDRFFAYGQHTVSVSTDGRTWKAVLTVRDTQGNIVVSGGNGLIFACPEMSDKYFVSYDNGESWKDFEATLVQDLQDCTDVVADVIQKKLSSFINSLKVPAAGNDLGTVKTGGDVTIENGVITVNDDSHAHTTLGKNDEVSVETIKVQVGGATYAPVDYIFYSQGGIFPNSYIPAKFTCNEIPYDVIHFVSGSEIYYAKGYGDTPYGEPGWFEDYASPNIMVLEGIVDYVVAPEYRVLTSDSALEEIRNGLGDQLFVKQSAQEVELSSLKIGSNIKIGQLDTDIDGIELGSKKVTESNLFTKDDSTFKELERLAENTVIVENPLYGKNNFQLTDGDGNASLFMKTDMGGKFDVSSTDGPHGKYSIKVNDNIEIGQLDNNTSGVKIGDSTLDDNNLKILTDFAENRNADIANKLKSFNVYNYDEETGYTVFGCYFSDNAGQGSTLLSIRRDHRGYEDSAIVELMVDDEGSFDSCIRVISGSDKFKDLLKCTPTVESKYFEPVDEYYLQSYLFLIKNPQYDYESYVITVLDSSDYIGVLDRTITAENIRRRGFYLTSMSLSSIVDTNSFKTASKHDATYLYLGDGSITETNVKTLKNFAKNGKAETANTAEKLKSLVIDNYNKEFGCSVFGYYNNTSSVQGSMLLTIQEYNEGSMKYQPKAIIEVLVDDCGDFGAKIRVLAGDSFFQNILKWTFVSAPFEDQNGYSYGGRYLFLIKDPSSSGYVVSVIDSVGEYINVSNEDLLDLVSAEDFRNAEIYDASYLYLGDETITEENIDALKEFSKTGVAESARSVDYKDIKNNVAYGFDVTDDGVLVLDCFTAGVQLVSSDDKVISASNSIRITTEEED